MNIEQAFVKTDNISKVKDVVKKRLNSNPDTSGLQPDVGLPSSYDAILAKEQKRKIAISELKDEWVSILESKEVNDYKMLLEISKELNCEVIVIVISDVTGEWGFSELCSGTVLNSYFSEDDDDIEGLIGSKLRDKKIKLPLCMFREVASRKIAGWSIITKD